MSTPNNPIADIIEEIVPDDYRRTAANYVADVIRDLTLREQHIARQLRQIANEQNLDLGIVGEAFRTVGLMEATPAAAVGNGNVAEAREKFSEIERVMNEIRGLIF